MKTDARGHFHITSQMGLGLVKDHVRTFSQGDAFTVTWCETWAGNAVDSPNRGADSTFLVLASMTLHRCPVGGVLEIMFLYDLACPPPTWPLQLLGTTDLGFDKAIFLHRQSVSRCSSTSIVLLSHFVLLLVPYISLYLINCLLICKGSKGFLWGRVNFNSVVAFFVDAWEQLLDQ